MLLDISDLTVELPHAGTRRPVLDGVSLRVRGGEIVGLVGESGSGKSTTAKAALRLLPESARTTGRVGVREVDVVAAGPAQLRDLRSRHVSMVHQDPRASLNPVRRIGDLVTERMTLGLGTPRTQARARAVRLLGEVGIDRPERRMRQFPHELSGGMLQRVVIAQALACDPDLLLADEATSALDATTQAEILALLRRLRDERGMGMLVITHDLHLAAAYCDRVCVMYAGLVVEDRPAGALFSDPRHPYTRALLACTPDPDSGRSLAPIPGQPPSLDTAFGGCPFAPRCPDAEAECETWRPHRLELDDGGAACRRITTVPTGE